MNCSISPATPRDVERIFSFLEHVHLVREGLFESGTLCWISEGDAGELAGIIGLEVGETVALLRSAGVHPDVQGRGLGKRLVEHVFEYCRKTGLLTVYCFSTGAGDYWKKHGFYEVSVSEVVTALPQSPQVKDFERRGWLPTEVAWRKDLS